MLGAVGAIAELRMRIASLLPFALRCIVVEFAPAPTLTGGVYSFSTRILFPAELLVADHAAHLSERAGYLQQEVHNSARNGEFDKCGTCAAYFLWGSEDGFTCAAGHHICAQCSGCHYCPSCDNAFCNAHGCDCSAGSAYCNLFLELIRQSCIAPASVNRAETWSSSPADAPPL
eukprot:gene2126-3934_t